MNVFAQGWSHAFTGNDLFEDNFQAWQHGPVIPDLYHRYTKTFYF
ncbi:TPA: type II toxin-antitoxin system antitoxin SocA domain-containing protein [Bacillus cereus]